MRQAYLSTANANLVPSLLLLGAVTGPATFVVFIYGRDWHFDVGGATVMAVGFVGGIIGVTAASILEYHTLVTLGSLPLVAVAVIEEAVKLAAPLAVLLLRRCRRLANGLLLGVASGAGFAIMETLGYSAVELIQSHENVAEVNTLLLRRGLFSPTTHMAWTGLTATALWYAASQGWHIRGPGRLRGRVLSRIGPTRHLGCVQLPRRLRDYRAGQPGRLHRRRRPHLPRQPDSRTRPDRTVADPRSRNRHIEATQRSSPLCAVVGLLASSPTKSTAGQGRMAMASTLVSRRPLGRIAPAGSERGAPLPSESALGPDDRAVDRNQAGKPSNEPREAGLYMSRSVDWRQRRISQVQMSMGVSEARP